MKISIKDTWDFKPEFAGGKITVTLKPIGGAQELSLGVGKDRDMGGFLGAIIVKISPSITLEIGGKSREMTPYDIAEIAELRHLYYEILAEYGRQTNVNGDEVKNSP